MFLVQFYIFLLLKKGGGGYMLYSSVSNIFCLLYSSASNIFCILYPTGSNIFLYTILKGHLQSFNTILQSKRGLVSSTSTFCLYQNQMGLFQVMKHFLFSVLHINGLFQLLLQPDNSAQNREKRQVNRRNTLISNGLVATTSQNGTRR